MEKLKKLNQVINIFNFKIILEWECFCQFHRPCYIWVDFLISIESDDLFDDLTIRIFDRIINTGYIIQVMQAISYIVKRYVTLPRVRPSFCIKINAANWN